MVQALLVGIDLDVEHLEAFEVVLVCLDVLQDLDHFLAEEDLVHLRLVLTRTLVAVVLVWLTGALCAAPGCFLV